MKQKQENQKRPDRQEQLQKALIKGKVNPKIQSQIKNAANQQQSIMERRRRNLNAQALNRFESEQLLPQEQPKDFNTYVPHFNKNLKQFGTERITRQPNKSELSKLASKLINQSSQKGSRLRYPTQSSQSSLEHAAGGSTEGQDHGQTSIDLNLSNIALLNQNQ